MFFNYLIVGMIIYFMIRLTRSFFLHNATVSLMSKYSKKMTDAMINDHREYIINKTRDDIIELATQKNEVCLKIKEKLETGEELDHEELQIFSCIMAKYIKEILNKEIYPKMNYLGFYKKMYGISDYEDGSYIPTFFDAISILIRGTFAYDYRDIIDEEMFNTMNNFVSAE